MVPRVGSGARREVRGLGYDSSYGFGVTKAVLGRL
jgi:hypothetical protein